MSASQTALQLTNDTGQSVQVYLTLGKTTGCVGSITDIPFVTNTIPNNDLQGWFTLQPKGQNGDSVSYTPPMGMGFNGNFAFGTPPLNCPTETFPNGVNFAEFILNNSFQGAGAQETLDISAVAGVNAFIQFSMSGGGTWNAGTTQPTVTEFENKGIGDNVGQVGVYPYGCDVCTASAGPPVCSPPPRDAPNPLVPQKEPICNVQRDASASGGTVTLTFKGFA
ncbi:MAG: hypothetical protein QOJ76_2117 [Acidobacteriota bacterium]|jgi:hypothetical protein|nr:hypothetical protein [Acidobacteriota bacterium]